MKKATIWIGISIIFVFLMTGCGHGNDVLVSFSEENKVDNEAVGELTDSGYEPENINTEGIYHKEIPEQNPYDDFEEEDQEDDDENGYIPDETDETQGEENEYKAVYEPVISEIVEALLDGHVDGREYEYVPESFFEIAEEHDYSYLPQEIGFVLTDINGDGVKELIIGKDYSYDDVRLQTSIYCIFTKRDDKAFAVFSDGDGSDIRYKWLGSGKLLYMEQISETEEAYGDFHLSADGTDIEWDNFYFSYVNIPVRRSRHSGEMETA